MKDCISAKLNSVIGSVLTVYLEEAEVEVYPFATYDINIKPFYTKDGIYKLVADVTIYVIATDESVAREKSEAVKAAIASQMMNDQYMSFEISETPKCYEGIWDLETVYKITQHYPDAEPEPVIETTI